MPAGGRLTIETGNTYIDEQYAAAHTEVQAGQYVLLAVGDTGCGMDANTLSRAFEPFYTTKSEGKGTANPDLSETEARAVVFDGVDDVATRNDALVLKNTGPRSPAGMLEAGHLPIPRKLARAGIKDMLRISDCRMSGTAFGTIVLHVTPEAATPTGKQPGRT